MTNRDQKIEEIVSFVDHYKDTIASKSVCARILGDKHIKIDNEVVNELRARLPNASEDELNACYYLVK